nr:hypothetical protein [Burkholderia ambifaria]
MSVVISMIGAEGLGLVVLQGLGRLDVGQAAIGGVAIVMLAMMLDRVTQKLARSRPGAGGSLRSVVVQLVRGGRGGPAAPALPEHSDPKQAL